jgi:anhydro-N-acetylmuramic acid kinase
MRNHDVLAVDVLQAVAFHFRQNPVKGGFEIGGATEARTEGVAKRRKALIREFGIRAGIDQLVGRATFRRLRPGESGATDCGKARAKEKEKSFHGNIRIAVGARLCPNKYRNARMGEMKKHLVLGIMSGTSIDGVDYALCEIGAADIALREFWSARFPSGLRETLRAAARGDLPSHKLAQAHHDLGRFYAARAMTKCGERPDLVGLHGQTVFHNPSARNPATLQLGEPAYLAERLRVPVISNFRAADMAAGGQGAPLATIFHELVFARRGEHVCVNNLGGISNVTSLDWRRDRRPCVMAFDTGPANALNDLAMRYLTDDKMSMDKNGRWAARGKPSEAILRRWLQHDYFRRKPPKSTGPELFGEAFFKMAVGDMKGLAPFDQLATLTEFTAHSLALNYKLHLPGLPRRIILSGGGASNPTLVAAITRQFSGQAIEIQTSESWGWPVRANEPAAFALLADLRMRGKPGNLPQTTGARRSALLGQESR